MTETIREQILAIRDTGLTNMFDIPMVQRLAMDRPGAASSISSQATSPQVTASACTRRIMVSHRIPTSS